MDPVKIRSTGTVARTRNGHDLHDLALRSSDLESDSDLEDALRQSAPSEHGDNG